MLFSENDDYKNKNELRFHKMMNRKSTKNKRYTLSL